MQRDREELNVHVLADYLFIYLFIWCNWVCSTQTINVTMIRTGWDMVFLFSRIFKIISLPLRCNRDLLEFEVFVVPGGIADTLLI